MEQAAYETEGIDAGYAEALGSRRPGRLQGRVLRDEGRLLTGKALQEEQDSYIYCYTYAKGTQARRRARRRVAAYRPQPEALRRVSGRDKGEREGRGAQDERDRPRAVGVYLRRQERGRGL